MKSPRLNNFNEMYTPTLAIDYIIPFLDKNLIYYEMCYWKWHIANYMINQWFKIVWWEKLNCFEENNLKYDFIITNPPFNGNKKFIKRALELDKPFAFLIRLEHLWWCEAFNIFKDIDFQIIIPKNRINYITPKILSWIKTWWASFHSIWFTYWMWLKKQINYIL